MSIVRLGMALTLCFEASVSKGWLNSRGEINCLSVLPTLASSFW
jgi:hypothetical protein